MTVQTKEPKAKTCKICEAEFTTYNSCQKYCSLDCAKTAKSAQVALKSRAANKKNKARFKQEYGDKIGRLTQKCATCKQPYERYASQVKHRGSTYCSVECRRLGQIKSRSRTQLIKALDTVYSQYIRNKYADKDGNVMCVTCQIKKPVKEMQNGHYVSRTFHNTRWLDKNCHPQCYSCNVGLGGNYAKYSRFMIDTYGAEVIDELITISQQPLKLSKQDLQDRIDVFTEQLKALL